MTDVNEVKKYGWFSKRQYECIQEIKLYDKKNKGCPMYLIKNGNKVVCSLITNTNAKPPYFDDIVFLGEIGEYIGRYSEHVELAAELNNKSLNNIS